MEVWDWWPFIRRRVKTILWIAVLAVVVTMAVTFVLPTTYRSAATLNVQPLAEDQALSYPSASQMVARNVGELIKSPEVARRAAKALGKTKLESTFEFSVPEDTSIVEIIADAESPKGAADEANAVAEAFIAYNNDTVRESVSAAQENLKYQITQLRAQIRSKQNELAAARLKAASTAAINGLQDELDSLQTGYEGVLQRWQALPGSETMLTTSVSLVDPALPDSEAVSPRPVLNLLLAIAGGLLLGVAVARATEPAPEPPSGD